METIELSPRQSQVLVCMANDLSTKQIAHAIGACERTVMMHITEIKNALDCGSRAGAIARACAVGTLRWDDEHEQWLCATRDRRLP